MKELVAVYGSLKKGYGNHRVMEMANGRYVGVGVTQKDEFIMDGHGYPYIIRAKDNPLKRRVLVEVYEVPKEGLLRHLDSLEGHPHFYKREKEKIRMENGDVVDAWLYIYQSNIKANPNLIEKNIYVW